MERIVIGLFFYAKTTKEQRKPYQLIFVGLQRSNPPQKTSRGIGLLTYAAFVSVRFLVIGGVRGAKENDDGRRGYCVTGIETASQGRRFLFGDPTARRRKFRPLLSAVAVRRATNLQYLHLLFADRHDIFRNASAAER